MNLEIGELDDDDQVKIDQLLNKSRVIDFTLSVFMANIWFNSVVAVAFFGVFFCFCRPYRSDKERFMQKLHRMTLNRSDVESSDDEHQDKINLYHLDDSIRHGKESGQRPNSPTNRMDMEHATNWLRVNLQGMSPIGILGIIDDSTMIRMFGRDRFLYLKFLKYQAWFFLTIFVIGWTILLPTYNTGNDADRYILMNSIENAGADAQMDVQELGHANTDNSEDDINLLKFTILNQTSDTTMLLIPYCFTIATALIMYVFIFFFWRVTHSYDYTAPDRLDDKGYSQLHRHVLLLKGIPKNIAPNEANWMIKQTLNITEFSGGKDNQDDSYETPDPDSLQEEKIFKVKTVGDYNEQYPLTQEIDSLNKQIALSEKHEKMLE